MARAGIEILKRFLDAFFLRKRVGWGEPAYRSAVAENYQLAGVFGHLVAPAMNFPHEHLHSNEAFDVSCFAPDHTALRRITLPCCTAFEAKRSLSQTSGERGELRVCIKGEWGGMVKMELLHLERL